MYDTIPTPPSPFNAHTLTAIIKVVVQFLLLPIAILWTLLFMVPEQVVCVPFPPTKKDICLNKRNTRLVAFFPGYEIRDWLNNNDSFVGLYARDTDELMKIARWHSDAADVLILSAGATAELTQTPRVFDDYDCRLRKADIAGRGLTYDALLVVNPACGQLYTRLSQTPEMSDRITVVRGFWQQSASTFLDSLVLRDAHSMSGYYVPLQVLGIASAPRMTRLTCMARRTPDDVAQLVGASSCTILAIGSDEWNEAKQSAGPTVSSAVEIVLAQRLPRGPTCIRKGRFSDVFGRRMQVSEQVSNTLESRPLIFDDFTHPYNTYVRPVQGNQGRLTCTLFPDTASLINVRTLTPR